MRVQTDFEIKHFIAYTKMNGGMLEILHSDNEFYTAEYQNDAYKITHDAMNKIKLLNQNLVVKNRIVQ